MRDGVVGDEHHRSRGRHTWILHACNRYSWVWRHWMERMGVDVGCSGVHRLSATSVVSIAATFRFALAAAVVFAIAATFRFALAAAVVFAIAAAFTTRPKRVLRNNLRRRTVQPTQPATADASVWSLDVHHVRNNRGRTSLLPRARDEPEQAR